MKKSDYLLNYAFNIADFIFTNVEIEEFLIKKHSD